MLRPILHVVLHFVVPVLAARLGWKDRWKTAWLVMVATMLIDLDHLLADPIYDPDRCSIATHPLHGWWAIGVYVGMLFPKRTRLLGTGLVIHIALDALDCALM